MPDFDDDDTELLEKQVEGITKVLDDLDFVLRYAEQKSLVLKVESEADGPVTWWYADLFDSRGVSPVHGDGDGLTPAAAVASLAWHIRVEAEEEE